MKTPSYEICRTPFLDTPSSPRQENPRTVLRAAAERGIAAPVLIGSRGHFDAYGSAWMPVNLVEAQRDYFGSHTYERIDAKGVFHTHWSAK